MKLRCPVLVQVTLVTSALLSAGNAWSLPLANNCQVDPVGANDRPGQRDVTMFCVDTGASDPWELHAVVNLDEIAVSGGNTIDSCMLFNTVMRSRISPSA
jgi:hypothetical protein